MTLKAKNIDIEQEWLSKIAGRCPAEFGFQTIIYKNHLGDSPSPHQGIQDACKLLEVAFNYSKYIPVSGKLPEEAEEHPHQKCEELENLISNCFEDYKSTVVRTFSVSETRKEYPKAVAIIVQMSPWMNNRMVFEITHSAGVWRNKDHTWILIWQKSKLNYLSKSWTCAVIIIEGKFSFTKCMQAVVKNLPPEYPLAILVPYKDNISFENELTQAAQRNGCSVTCIREGYLRRNATRSAQYYLCHLLSYTGQEVQVSAVYSHTRFQDTYASFQCYGIGYVAFYKVNAWVVRAWSWWSRARLLWIGWKKNNPQDCPLARLPQDLIKILTRNTQCV